MMTMEEMKKEFESFSNMVEENMARIQREREQMKKESEAFHKEWEIERKEFEIKSAEIDAEIARIHADIASTTHIDDSADDFEDKNETGNIQQYLFDENNRLFREEHERFMEQCNYHQSMLLNSMMF